MTNHDDIDWARVEHAADTEFGKLTDGGATTEQRREYVKGFRHAYQEGYKDAANNVHHPELHTGTDSKGLGGAGDKAGYAYGYGDAMALMERTGVSLRGDAALLRAGRPPIRASIDNRPR